MHWLDQPAVRRMVPRGTLAREAAELDAAIILCSLKRFGSTPARLKVVLTQREIVLLVTGLYGFTNLINKFLTLPLRGFVRDKYLLTVETGKSC